MSEIHQETWIKAARSTVFRAITTRHGLDSWWGTAVSAEPEVGHVVELDHQLGNSGWGGALTDLASVCEVTQRATGIAR
jgi:uncharacterized protein YndB with AHSA1/START domain